MLFIDLMFTSWRLQLAFLNTLLNQALWISLMTLLINNQNLYFFSSANQCPSRGSTHGERAWGCKEKAYHGQSKKISNWLRAVWTVWVSLICEIQICMGLRIFIYFVHGWNNFICHFWDWKLVVCNYSICKSAYYSCIFVHTYFIGWV